MVEDENQNDRSQIEAKLNIYFSDSKKYMSTDPSPSAVNVRFHPESPFMVGWGLASALLTIYLAVEIPLRLIFDYETPPWLKISDTLVTIFFAIDIFIRFNTGYFDEGQLIKEKALVRADYLKGAFIIDVLATIPFELIFLVLGVGSGKTMGDGLRLFRLFRLFRLLRVIRLFSLFKRRSHLLDKPIILNIFQYSVMSFLASHAIACGWLLVAGFEVELDHFTNYITALYWTITTLTTVGYGDISPSDNLGRIYTMGVMILGVAMYAFIIGNISTLLVKVDAYQEKQREKMSNLVSFMKHHGIPKTLYDEVVGFYVHFLTVNTGEHGAEVMKDLPAPLRQQLELYVNLKLINMVPFFNPLSQSCKKALCKVLEPIVVGPDEYIIKEGDHGNEMFFIGHGVLEVLNTKREKIVELKEGSFFGEIALMEDVTRTASVKSLSYCNLYKLGKEDFLCIMEAFDELKIKIEEVKKEREQQISGS